MVDRTTLQSALRTSVDKELAERTQAHQERVARLLSAAKVLSADGVAGPQMPLSLLAHGDSSLDFAGWTVAADGAAIVRQALQEFQNALSALAAVAANNFALVLTQGTLTGDEWANELHPTSMGFADIAERILLALRTRFPGRI